MSDGDSRVPITVITGFLGAGKTTLVNRLLRQPDMARAAVIVNEFGAVGIDHALVKRLDESVVLLASGCVCCTMASEFGRALRALFMRSIRREIPPLAHVVLETSGLADPGAIGASLAGDPFLTQRYRMHGTVTVVDAAAIAQQIERHVEARRQLAATDLVVLGKVDIATSEQLGGARASIAGLAPGAPTLRALHGDVDCARVLASGTAHPRNAASALARWLLPTRNRNSPNGAMFDTDRLRHSTAVWSAVLTIDRPLSRSTVADAIDALLENHGDSMLRIKGLINLDGTRGPGLLDCVGRWRGPIIELQVWPDDGVLADRRSRLVVIAQSLAPNVVEEALCRLGGGWLRPA